MSLPKHNRIKSCSVRQALILFMLGLGLASCTNNQLTQRPVAELAPPKTGDQAAGEKAYQKNCMKCHQLTPGQNKKGPQLLHVYGAKVALLSDYRYSQELRRTEWTWTPQKLSLYIKDPQAAVPDTRMRTDGIKDTATRQNIIAYLASLNKQQLTSQAPPSGDGQP